MNENNSKETEVVEVEKFRLLTVDTDENVNLLRRVSENVSFVAGDNSGNVYLDNDTQELIQALKDFVVENDGLGMSAIQLNVPKRVFVMRKPWNSNRLLTVINPTIIRSEGQSRKAEGCFSIPEMDGVAGMVQRPSRIWVNFFDENGVEYKDELMVGMDARVFQHELDHLNGKLFIDNKLVRGGKFLGWTRV